MRIPERINITPEIISESEAIMKMDGPLVPLEVCNCPMALAIQEQIGNDFLVASKDQDTLIGISARCPDGSLIMTDIHEHLCHSQEVTRVMKKYQKTKVMAPVTIVINKDDNTIKTEYEIE